MSLISRNPVEKCFRASLERSKPTDDRHFTFRFMARLETWKSKQWDLLLLGKSCWILMLRLNPSEEQSLISFYQKKYSTIASKMKPFLISCALMLELFVNVFTLSLWLVKRISSLFRSPRVSSPALCWSTNL